MSFYAPSPTEFTEITSAIQTAAKKAQNVSSKRRHSSIIQVEIDRLIGNDRVLPQTEGDLPCARRQLQQATDLRAELVTSLDTLTTRLATLKAENVHPSRYQDLVGYDFVDRAQRKVHHDGTIDVVKIEIERLDKRIAVLTKAVETLQERVITEVPKLKDELDAALRLERLEGR